MNQVLLNLSTQEAVVIAVVIVALMGIMMIGFGFTPHLALIVVLCVLFAFGKFKGLDFNLLQKHMANGVMGGIGAVYLFFFIGLLVVALMSAGTIPTLMYYGFEIISPNLFYLSAFVLTSIIGIALGSSLTTCATIGVAFIGMTSAFGADPAIVAGAVVSGAFFGDKMSPLSDTGTIASSVVGIDLFTHIKNMMYTTIPAWLLSALIFYVLSSSLHQANLANISQMQKLLLSSHLVHLSAFLPIVVLIGLIVLRVNAIYTIILSILVAIGITYSHSSPSIQDMGNYFFAGFKAPQELGVVADLLSRGGLESMFFSLAIVMLALSLGGLLQALGVLPALLNAMKHLLTKPSRAIAATAFTGLGINILIGEQYLSLLLSGHTFRDLFAKFGLHPKNLSRTLEDAGTVINPLVPWSVCGVFISQVLNVSVLSYLPYAFFCYLCFILTLVFGMTGFTISKIDNK
ncbi:Na+/H+ antiporter NhaC [Moraxella macacae 0408225]|uniref:Na+/H+ antiporter NhaC n=1 Tax=Moraxella macacae 0408225 TaxID=1230338 RepID=L2F5Y1_9GAMM|nr:Na+/H+ antiporter NhaC [Moraxella macacae]ELA08469.1 Na+/H+ antiporter NhaC [Moraxella macacae 0408225]